jgi:hypothetical protein
VLSLALKRKVAALAALAGISAGFVGTEQAEAHRRDFPYTYDWMQPSKGEKELELKSRYRGRNNSFRQEIEFEYGITDRFMIAPYLEFQKQAGDSNLRYTAAKLETRYQMGEYKVGKVLPGLYLEYIATKDGADEVEAKLILSRYGKDGSNISFNYVVERELENGAEFENQYSFGYARTLGKKGFLSGTRGGFEWIHNLNSGRINAGPVVGFSPTKDTWLTTGYAFPVNDRGGNQGEFRLLLEYEWF